MKTTLRFLLVLAAIICGQSTIVNAQTPQAIPYQAVARDVDGNLIANQSISLRFSIVDQYIIPTTYYKETQTAVSNTLGLFTANVGQGTPVVGVFADINWGGGFAKYLKVEMDATGGTNYIDMGSSPMLSVPYSLYSAKSGNGMTDGTTPGSTMYWNGSNWDNNTNLYNAGFNVGIGTVAPANKLDVVETGTNMAGSFQINNAANTTNALHSTTNGIGNAFYCSNTGTAGTSGYVAILNPSNPYQALFSTTTGTGNAAYFRIENYTSSASALYATTFGTGNAIEAAGKTKTTTFQMTNGAASNYVLTSDANGNASWANPATIIGPEIDPQVSSATMNKVPKWNGNTLADGSIYDDGNVGIGTASPVTKLHVEGQVTIVDGNQEEGKVLTSDDNGTARWAAPSGGDCFTHWQAFTTPGNATFTVPAGVTTIKVCVWGAGGGGGCDIALWDPNGGGGAGGYSEGILAEIPGTSCNVVVGAGGVQNTAGEYSSFNDGTQQLSCYGGNGGSTNGHGGPAYGGYLQIRGGNGGRPSNNKFPAAGDGGSDGGRGGLAQQGLYNFESVLLVYTDIAGGGGGGIGGGNGGNNINDGGGNGEMGAGGGGGGILNNNFGKGGNGKVLIFW